MYIPKPFEINDGEMMFDVIEQYSFATVISQHEGVPFATHLPLVLDREKRMLYGHFARPNHQWKDIEQQKVLVIFQGPHCYVSPSWYETREAVPTWNYVTVHVYGEIQVIQDEQEMAETLFSMVKQYEDPESSYDVNDLDPHYISGMQKGIVGFKLAVTSMEGKAKLSQNHPLKRQQMVMEKLSKQPGENERRIAELMKENLKQASINRQE
ncbi:FMN-binding negative transcriptional regulator [Fictibacillus sp. KIGAM418]|uniref:FMN-binding negative transcriptional regulator n=1 Tax=Fictibacillus marinisediminis TaxID=2878389 RepID=A0A9X1X8Y4_9BACL|nr:FMN-binding negative transcriptional regulator [Fictibacillus marinisediminis]MCK6256372.1 FMN-binding negative transcriptional regulator [Fictibacillus marinisediminis]